MVKVLIAALLGTVLGIVVMIVVIVITGGTTKGASPVGLTLSVSTAALSSPPSTSTSTGGSSTGGSSTGGSSTGGGGNPAEIAAGKTLFSANGCSSCHTLAAAGATGTIGPNLDTAVTSDAAKAKMPVGAFIKQSIVDPAAFTATGGPWATAMPTTFGGSLSQTQINDLVALIESGQTP
jgi:cytochrome c551/c552